MALTVLTLQPSPQFDDYTFYTFTFTFLATIDSCTHPDTVSYAGDMSVRKLKYEIFKVLCKYIYKVGAGDSCKKII